MEWVLFQRHLVALLLITTWNFQLVKSLHLVLWKRWSWKVGIQVENQVENSKLRKSWRDLMTFFRYCEIALWYFPFLRLSRNIFSFIQVEIKLNSTWTQLEQIFWKSCAMFLNTKNFQCDTTKTKPTRVWRRVSHGKLILAPWIRLTQRRICYCKRIFREFPTKLRTTLLTPSRSWISRFEFCKRWYFSTWRSTWRSTWKFNLKGGCLCRCWILVDNVKDHASIANGFAG